MMMRLKVMLHWAMFLASCLAISLYSCNIRYTNSSLVYHVLKWACLVMFLLQLPLQEVEPMSTSQNNNYLWSQKIQEKCSFQGMLHWETTYMYIAAKLRDKLQKIFSWCNSAFIVWVDATCSRPVFLYLWWHKQNFLCVHILWWVPVYCIHFISGASCGFLFHEPSWKQIIYQHKPSQNVWWDMCMIYVEIRSWNS